jgi:predicted RNase H-like nuclease
MSEDPLYVGVDRSDDGWVAVAFGEADFEHATVHESIGAVWAGYEETAERVLVAVPIGLRETGDVERPCDEAARAVLGPREGCVLTPPVREAARKRRYPAAKRVNERKAGRELSEAAFAISDAIVALDDLLQEVAEARDVLAEAHPAVCFRTFAGEPLRYSKRTAGGYAERMAALATFDRDAPPVVQEAAAATAGHDVAVHDVLDAIALAYTARPGPGDLHSLPADPPTDPTGLPMRMVYRAETPLQSG